MKLTDFDFDLPADRIARFPSEKRDKSRLMVVDRRTGKITHHIFSDITSLIDEDDFLVLNNTKVAPARLFGKIGDSSVEILIVKKSCSNEAEVLTMPGRKFIIGKKIIFNRGVFAEVIGIGERGKRILRFNKEIEEVYGTGYAPLPPYIKRKYDEAEKFRDFDLKRYQTLYSKKPGSIAAPTSGLHFTKDILSNIKSKNQVLEITLSVGPATFQKIEVEDINKHVMGTEYIHIGKNVADEIRRFKEKGNNLITIGTTTVRSLETFASYNIRSENFKSDLFIYPGFEFKLTDKMITNFHLPMSSLFILVSAFAGLELMKRAYKIAVEKGYRFFSYGDAMFIR